MHRWRKMWKEACCLLVQRCCTRPDRSKSTRFHALMEKDVEKGVLFARAETLYQPRLVRTNTLSRTYGDRLVKGRDG